MTGFGVIFFIVPIVNHIGIVVAIRRHNNQVHDAISGQNLSLLFRREKKAAVDMFLIMAALLLSLVPALIANINQKALQQHFEVMYAWSACFVYVNSSINPVIYLVRNGEIREAVKSMLRFWLEQFSIECRKQFAFVQLVLLYFALWLPDKTRATFWANEKQNQNQPRIACGHFHTLGDGCTQLPQFLIGSLRCFHLLWLVRVIALVLVLRQSTQLNWTIVVVQLSSVFCLSIAK